MTPDEFKALAVSERAKQPASVGFVLQMVDGMINGLKKSKAKREERLVAIEKRLAELERNAFEYDGVFEIGKAYRKGQFVTFQGSLWACKADTLHAPGTNYDWQLAAKRGKDGKDSNAP